MVYETVSIIANSIVRTAKDVVSCELDGETAILNARTGIYYGLDEVGACVWRLLNEPHTVTHIVAAIMSEFDIDMTQCQIDVIGLLRELVAHGLVEIADGAGS